MIPPIIYGTAWKEDATEELVLKALKAGYRAVDTANQRKHYYEAAVGEAVSKSKLKRNELFLQTKFTYAGGQDNRIPYDAKADYKSQVRQSFESSLEHLKTDYIDSYVLHGPSVHQGLSNADWEVWREMEKLFKEKKAIVLGVSNVTLLQLTLLLEGSKVKPLYVQNRCFAQLGWDHDVRVFCRKHDMIYQGFSLLTANHFILPALNKIAKKYKRTPEQILFRFAKYIGILPLTGTTDETHMKQDLELDFSMDEEEIRFIEFLAVS